ncbi:hypothetical protein LCGC14_0711090 [marine sediment metagenome]|uniref:Uncharacterized protein n=1 Tax=marine sediment metagenome TaxID=412755 RepID=A0A0F9R0G3_9ZZZZ
MDAKQLGNMILFVVGFLLLWAALRMTYVLVRPRVEKVAPDLVGAADFVLM